MEGEVSYHALEAASHGGWQVEYNRVVLGYVLLLIERNMFDWYYFLVNKLQILKLLRSFLHRGVKGGLGHHLIELKVNTLIDRLGL